MKRVVLPFCIVLVSSLFCPAADDVKVKRLFNGKNLDGWKGYLAADSLDTASPGF